MLIKGGCVITQKNIAGHAAQYLRYTTVALIVSTLGACGGGSSESSQPPEEEEDLEETPVAHIVTGLSGAGGAINHTNLAVAHGDTASLILTPDTGYHIGNVTGCGGSLAGNIYTTAEIISNCTVIATFSLNTHSIVLSATPPSGGTTVGSGVYEYGSEITVTAIPNDNYSFSSWAEEGVIISTDIDYMFPVTSNRTLIAAFDPIPNIELVQMPPAGRATLFQANNAPSGVFFVSTEEVVFGDGGSGIWLTEDGGMNWLKTTDIQASFISIASEDPNFIIADYHTPTSSHIRSFDGGHTWISGPIPIFATVGNSVLIRGAATITPDQEIYVVSPSLSAGGLYRSVNMGQSWQRIFVGFLHHIHVSPANPDIIYVATSSNGDIWRSTDRGESFHSIKPGISVDPSVFDDGLQVNTENPDLILVRGNISVNGGANWNQIPGLSPSHTTWVDNTLLRVINNWLYGSMDFGASWIPVLEIVSDTFFDFPAIHLSEDALFLEIKTAPRRVYRMDLQFVRDKLKDI